MVYHVLMLLSPTQAQLALQSEIHSREMQEQARLAEVRLCPAPSMHSCPYVSHDVIGRTYLPLTLCLRQNLAVGIETELSTLQAENKKLKGDT